MPSLRPAEGLRTSPLMYCDRDNPYSVNASSRFAADARRRRRQRRRPAWPHRPAEHPRFNEVVGCAPIEYLARWCIAIAKRALLSGAKSLDRIADEIGCKSTSSFSTAFSKRLGCSRAGSPVPALACLRSGPCDNGSDDRMTVQSGNDFRCRPVAGFSQQVHGLVENRGANAIALGSVPFFDVERLRFNVGLSSSVCCTRPCSDRVHHLT